MAEAQGEKKPAHRHTNYNQKQHGNDYSSGRKQHRDEYNAGYNRPYDGLGDYNRQYDGPSYNRCGMLLSLPWGGNLILSDQSRLLASAFLELIDTPTLIVSMKPDAVLCWVFVPCIHMILSCNRHHSERDPSRTPEYEQYEQDNGGYS